MENRRSFLLKLAVFLWLCVTFSASKVRKTFAEKTKDPKRVLVLWYSQTGYTARYGKLIRAVWASMGLDASGFELREIEPESVTGFDLILVGSPVFYYDSPEYVKQWLERLPNLEGIPVASYVSFGGPEGDQHNAACSILDILKDKGGRPVGMDMFMNMGTYPLSWNDETLASPDLPRHKTLPDEKTYDRVRTFARDLVTLSSQGHVLAVDKKLTLRRFSTAFNPIYWTKKSIQSHAIAKDLCVQCGTCQAKCPVDAIDPFSNTVNTDRCVLCFGCLNTCPQQAVIMMHKDRKLIGFNHLLSKKNIIINAPRELI